MEDRYADDRIRVPAPDPAPGSLCDDPLVGGAGGQRQGLAGLRAGTGNTLKRLEPYLTAERGAIPYAELALALQTSEGAVRVAAHRLRKRFRELFREVIAETVSGAEEAEAELRHIIGVLSRG